MVRKCRKHLRMNVTMRHAKCISLERIAMHEAAHCIVTLAYGMTVLFVHLSPVLGGKRIGIMPKHDGFFAAVVNHESSGPVAMAGMIQDKADWIGPADAMMLFGYLTTFPTIGRYPSMKPDLVDKTIEWARRRAAGILRRESKAVRAVASLFMTPGRVHFDGAEIREVAVSASRTLPKLNANGEDAAACWKLAMGGDASAAIRFMGPAGAMIDLVRKERAKKGRARRVNPKTDACPATRP